MLRKRLTRILGGLLLLSFVCITSLIIYSFAYTRWGRITNFEPFTEYAITGTTYKLTSHMENQVLAHVSLIDEQTNTTDEIMSGYDPHVTSFRYDSQTYTLIRLDGGGSDGAYNYVILGVDPLWI